MPDSSDVVVVMALGGGEDGPSWIHLPEGTGAATVATLGASLLGPDEPVRIERLHASSPAGSLGVPGEVTLPSETTLRELREILDGELGPGAAVHDLRMGIDDGGLVLELREGGSVRLEAPSDARLVNRLAAALGIPAARIQALFSWIREEAVTERHLRVTMAERGMHVVERSPGVDRALPREGIRIDA